LAFLKAADTRPNASFTLKLPKRIRGWIPPDYDRMYDDRYNGWYDDDYDEDYDDYDDEEYDEYDDDYDEYDDEPYDEDDYDDDYDEGGDYYDEDYGNATRRYQPPTEEEQSTRFWNKDAGWDSGPLWPQESLGDSQTRQKPYDWGEGDLK
jgi:hypothetical protein